MRLLSIVFFLIITTNLQAFHLNQGNPNQNDAGRLVIKKWHEDEQDRVLIAADENGVINLGVNAEFSGTPEKVHNGTDSAEWTAAAVSGTWDFASTDEAYAGTKSIDASLAVNGSVAKFNNGIVTTNYTAITLWIKITKWDSADDGIDVYAWDTTANVQIGLANDIKDHINEALIGEWQRATLPLSEMALSTVNVNEIRIETTGTGVAPDYYIDEFQFEESGTPVEYYLRPRANTAFALQSLSFVIFNPDYDLATANVGGVTPIDYTDFFGVSLTEGFNYELSENGDVEISIAINDLGDLLFFNDLEIFNIASRNGKSFINLRIMTDFTTPVFRSDQDDWFKVTVQDDLSGLDFYLVGTGTEIPLTDYLKGNY